MSVQSPNSGNTENDAWLAAPWSSLTLDLKLTQGLAESIFTHKTKGMLIEVRIERCYHSDPLRF
jgi:hypothetical protein